MTANSQAQPAVFLDRDGVINRDHGYVSSWQDFELLPGVVDALRALQDLGYALIIITNQSGIGRGYYDEADFWSLMDQLLDHLSERQVFISAVYFCPHHPNDALPEFRRVCDCRKPAPGMILQAIEDLDLDPARSILVGDKPSDIEAGRHAGVPKLFFVNPDGALCEDATSVLDLADVVSQLSKPVARV